MLRFLSLLALVVAVLRLYAAGLLSEPYVLLALLAGGGVLAFGPRWRLALLALTGLAFLVREYGGSAPAELMAHVLALVLVLWAMQWMLRCVFRIDR